jgi:adenosylhomocysteine nucleosidase
LGVLTARLGIVVGLAAEARIARPLGETAIGGGLPEGAEAAAERLVTGGATALLSFGLAGGLDPLLRAGQMVVPECVLEAGLAYPTDAGLNAWLGGLAVPMLLAGDAIVAGIEDKRALFAATGAPAIDLESGAVARVALRHGLPFAVLRAICDPATRALPPAALVALDGGGAIGLLRVLASVARRPAQIAALLALARDASAAQRALRGRVERLSGPRRR